MWGHSLEFVAPIFLVTMLWSLFWQGLGLWHAARRGEWIWFAIFLFVNTLGILEIIYLFGVAKIKMADLFTLAKPHHS